MQVSAKNGIFMKRPVFNNTIAPKVFESFYWKKKELIAFCQLNGIPTMGSKIELTQKIIHFLKTGKILTSCKIVKVKHFDSEQPITKNTPVANYRNDAKTREFFQSQIGKQFHFNAYLRQFSQPAHEINNLTYGDLVKGWIKSEEEKKLSGKKTIIAKQFQYNQFQRDFYAAEKGKSRKEFKQAWELVRSVPGDASYEHYRKLKKVK